MANLIAKISLLATIFIIAEATLEDDDASKGESSTKCHASENDGTSMFREENQEAISYAVEAVIVQLREMTQNANYSQLLFAQCSQAMVEKKIVTAFMMQGEIVSEIHRVAFHEAGHAVACRRNKDCNQIRFITAAAGVDVKNDGKRYPYHGKTVVAGRESYTRQQILATVEYFVGSTAAELLFFSAPFVPGMECDMHFARRAAEFIVCAIEEDGLKTVQLDLGKGACSKERLADPEIQRRIQQYIGEAIQRVNADFQNDDVKNIIKELAFKVFYSATLTLQTQEVYRFFAEHTEAEFAQAGAVAPADISLPAGPMPAELHLHGDMEPQLRKLGMPTRLENGVIELSKEFTHPTVRRPGPHFEAVRPLVGPIPRQSARPVE